MKVVQPVGVFPRAAKAAVHCASRNIPCTRYSIALITKPAASPPKNKRGMFGRSVGVMCISVSLRNVQAGGTALPDHSRAELEVTRCIRTGDLAECGGA